ncbi:MAG: hypothetical protein A3I72_08160 [Candidatus Tectomicrobia bacterium RIFCSPLOWO2_02_FULL_70_19]|nr:MAG: hypothetical protein A3I72_08160 [Candidatus Tectomicrobia bacterium RIFCSPLOWO2_02_FULL_70_19]
MASILRNALGYPQFSEAEWARRDALAGEIMAGHDLAALVVSGRPRGSALMNWLTHYPAQTPAWLVRARGGGPESDALLLHFYNHIECTRAFARPRNVRCYHPDPAGSVAGVLKELGAGKGRVGIAGLRSAILHAEFEALKQKLPEVTFVDVERAFAEARKAASGEEVLWYRESGRLTDAVCHAFEREIRPGLTEHDLQRIGHDAFLPEGGQATVFFVSSTPMSAPERGVPWQYLRPRRLEKGDVVIAEITVEFWGYRTQIHRAFAVAAEPAPVYRALFEAALECYGRVRACVRPGGTTREILAATDVLAERGFIVHDSLFHGQMGRNPEIGTRTSHHAFEDYTLRENEVVVVQPNPATPDGKAGLQLGAAMLVRPGGGECLHAYPFHFPVCGQGASGGGA